MPAGAAPAVALAPSAGAGISAADPGRRVVARPSRGRAPRGRRRRRRRRGARRAEQQVVDAQAGVALPAVAEVVPEGVDAARRGCSVADRVGPALRRAGAGSAARLSGCSSASSRHDVGLVDVESRSAPRCSRRPAPPAGRCRSSAARARSGARTRRACSRTSGPAAGCRWAGRGRRRARRRPPPRGSGCACRRVAGQAAARLDRRRAARQDRDAVAATSGRARSRRSRRRADRRRREGRRRAPSAPAGRRRRAATSSSHSSRRGRRPLMPLTLKVAIFIRRMGRAVRSLSARSSAADTADTIASMAPNAAGLTRCSSKPALERLRAIALLAVAGHRHQVAAGSGGVAQLARDLVAVHARQADVEEDDLRSPLVADLERLGPSSASRVS